MQKKHEGGRERPDRVLFGSKFATLLWGNGRILAPRFLRLEPISVFTHMDLVRVQETFAVVRILVTVICGMHLNDKMNDVKLPKMIKLDMLIFKSQIFYNFYDNFVTLHLFLGYLAFCGVFWLEPIKNKIYSKVMKLFSWEIPGSKIFKFLKKKE